MSDEEHQPTANRSPAQSAGLNAHLPERDRQPVLTSARDTGSGYGSRASLDVSSPRGGGCPLPPAGSTRRITIAICQGGAVRLYLSSFRMGACPQKLRELVSGDRAAVIANAMDGQPERERQAGLERELTALSNLGFRADHLDLRDFFERDDVGSVLDGYDLLWLRGGNVFMLRYALARSGADDAIVDLLANDTVCYGGYSAGPCVLGGSLTEFAEVDDPTVVTEMYGERAPDHGLGVLPWAFVPHVESPSHPETEGCGRVAARYAAAHTPLRTLRDGQVCILNGDTETLCC